MSNWRDELVEAVKSKAERETEEAARKAKRLTEALEVAEEALSNALEGLRFTHEQLADRLSRSRPQITNTLRLLKLPPLVQKRVAVGVLSATGYE